MGNIKCIELTKENYNSYVNEIEKQVASDKPWDFSIEYIPYSEDKNIIR